MQITSQTFKANTVKALADIDLQRALGNVEKGFIGKRQKAVDKLPEFDALRDNAVAIKTHTLKHLDLYIEAYIEKVEASGGTVHFAEDADHARRIFLDIAKRRGARTVTKGKTMISEEIGLNDFLEQNGMVPVETDLGATSSPRPSTSIATRWRPISGGFTSISTPSAI